VWVDKTNGFGCPGLELFDRGEPGTGEGWPQRSGLAPPEAQKRVDEILAEANRVTREAADTVRRGAVLTGLVTAVSLLIALAAAWWAALEGVSHRDKSINATLFGARTWPRPRQG
jgi:hypothetical protein